MVPTYLLMIRINVLVFLLAFPCRPAFAQTWAERFVTAMAANRDSSLLVLSLRDDRVGGEIVTLQPSTDHVLWTSRQPGTGSTLAFSPDGSTVAVGYHTSSEIEDAIRIFDAKTGKILAGQSDGPEEMPLGMGFASCGEDVEQVFFSPKGKVLAGISNDTLFAWNATTKEFLWSEDVPDRLHEATGHEGPTGHVVALGISDDGVRLAAARDRAVYIFAVEASEPKLLAQRVISPVTYGSTKLAFSPDRTLLALGVSGGDGEHARVLTLIWPPEGRARSIPDCGGGVAWLADS